MTDIITGQIKWYNNDRGFGVITDNSGKEYFLHQSQVPDGIEKLEIGIQLLFKAKPSPHHKGGEEAYDIELDYSPMLTPKPAQTMPQIHTKPKVVQTQPPVTDYWYQSYTVGINHRATNKKAPMSVKVVGVTYEGRQDIVALLHVGEEVQLVRDPHNPYDSNAIQVVRKNGQCFGFIGRDLAFSLAPKFDRYGQPVEATVKELTGGYGYDSSRGVIIQFNVPDASNNDSDFDY